MFTFKCNTCKIKRYIKADEETISVLKKTVKNDLTCAITEWGNSACGKYDNADKIFLHPHALKKLVKKSELA